MERVGEHFLSDMFRIVPHYFEHADARGTITGLLNAGVWREANLISSDAGVTRGRHFHKETEECFVILTGQIRALFRKQDDRGRWRQEDRQFGAGDVFIVYPWVEHTFVIVTAARWINLLSAPLNQDQPDFHRYPCERTREE